MAVDAIVREWHAEAGWGVLDAAETPGGCWAGFAHLAMNGYRELTSGQAVMLEYEPADQDGYAWRASRVWPSDTDPVEETIEERSAAYSSTLTVQWDE